MEAVTFLPTTLLRLPRPCRRPLSNAIFSACASGPIS